VLLAIVTTLGDGSINDLVTALGSEATTRSQADGTLQQNIDAEATTRSQADGTLQQNIDAEATTRSQADTTLQQNINAEAQARQLGDSTLQGGINSAMQAINAINNAIGNGCVYAGIATPSTTPAAGKVFYLALTAGTYTNFNGLEVSQGINILKNNGSTWSLESFVGIDDAPTPSSQKLVKSGGVFDEVMKNGSAFDLSAYNGGATYADLNAALTALNALPAAYKRGGMSVKFVQSSDNKYVQFRYMSSSTAAADFTNVANWQGVDDELTQNSENLIKSGSVAKVVGTPVQLGTDTAKTIPYEIVEGKTYYFKNNSTSAGSYVPVYVRETENGSNVLLFNLSLGETKKYIADTNYHYIRCTINKQPGGASNYEVFEGESINGELQKHDDIINQHTTDISDLGQSIQDAKIRTGIDEIAFEQGTITTSGGDSARTKRIRSINYLYGGYNILLPSGYNVSFVAYYNKTDNSFVDYRQPLVANYTILNTLTKDGVEYTVKARIVIAKTNDDDTITPEDIKKSFALEELYTNIKTTNNDIVAEKTRAEGAEGDLQQNITGLGNRVTSVETKANNTADIVKNVQICETDGSAITSVPCVMLAGHTYKVTNISNQLNYFAVYARETETSSNIKISGTLSCIKVWSSLQRLIVIS
jgi:hypothetical protein